jgi:DNA adenine methylase Dam
MNENIITTDRQTEVNYVKSPLNYTGNKFKLLPQILPLFPNDINAFIDLFGGGCNVGINSGAKKILYNEKQKEIVDLFQNLYITKLEEVLVRIEDTIKEYNGINTKEDYINLRNDYNISKEWYKLFVLCCYAFNFAVRFNSKGGFNMSSGVGSSSYNKSIQQRLSDFTNHIHKLNMKFLNEDFRKVDMSNLTENDFVYIDPPYLITTASYNENGGWTEKDEKDLYLILDELNKRNVKFAFSNVLVHKGSKNTLLIDWAKKYNTYMLNMRYDNTWGSTRKKEGKVKETIEVLITNY